MLNRILKALWLSLTVALVPQALSGQKDMATPEPSACLQWSSPEYLVEAEEARGAFSVASSPDAPDVVVGTGVRGGFEGPSARVLVLLQVGREAVPPPGDSFSYLNPRAVRDRDGRLHLFWGEPGHLARSGTSDRFRVGALWHAVYRDQQGWSQPTLLHDGGYLAWNTLSATVVATRDGSVHTLVPEALEKVIHVRIRDSEVSKTQLPMITANYSDFLEVSDSLLLLAYVGWKPDEGGEYNRIMLLRSTDQGQTWSEPFLVHSASDGFAQKLWLFGVGSEVIALWSANARGGVIQYRLRMARSVDQGVTWSQSAEHITEDEFGATDVAASSTPDGRIVVAWVPLAELPEGTPLRMERWSEGGWQRAQSVETEGSPSHPNLSRTGHGDIQLVWTEIREQSGTEVSIALRAAGWLRCNSHKR